MKYDGYRLRVERDGDRVRTRGHPRQTSQRPLLVKADVQQPYRKDRLRPKADMAIAVRDICF